jgi:hypothetical protein
VPLAVPVLHGFGCPAPLPAIACNGVGSIGNDVAGAFFSGLVSWFTSAAAWLLGLVGNVLTTTTTPPVTSHWFLAEEGVLLSVAAPVALVALVGAALYAVLRGDLSSLWRTVFLRLPLSVLLGAAGAGLVGLALGATDQLSTALATGSGTSLRAVMTELSASATASSSLPGGVAVVVAVVVILGALSVWIELVLRAAAITVLTAALPLVLAASLWPPAVAWARRVAETLGALVVSKVVVVLVLVVALDAVAHPGDGAASALTGGAMLLLAAFAPVALLRLIPIAEAAAISELEGVRHRAGAAVRHLPRQAVSLAIAGAPGALPSIDPIGSDPIGMAKGSDIDPFVGSPLDPEAKFTKSRLPLVAVPASAGRHVWERDEYGPRLVWKPPWHVDE